MTDDFSTAVIRWQKKHGRHDLPWQQDRDPYKIWLSEIMLQQTQVSTVIPYYQKFLRRFPALADLAQARLDSVMTLWSGLGYYSRARNLHAAARIMRRDGVPRDAAGWQRLPGVGKSTAAAVAVFSRGQRSAILDGNVKRVLSRAFLLPLPPNTPAAERALWALAESLLPPARHIRPYTQGLMDIGATCCRRRKPLCGGCPLAARCLAHQRGLTEEYPKRAAKKAKPQKSAHFILLRAGDKALLQKQPARGVWGGLWSLPLFGGGRRQWQTAVGCPLQKTDRLAFTHEFTHYRLNAAVSVYQCIGAPQPAAAPLRWHGSLKNIALPAPIKTLLA